MNLKKTIFCLSLLAAFPALSGCETANYFYGKASLLKYRGDGDPSVLLRTYIPQVAWSRGYQIEFPRFTPLTDARQDLAVINLPRWSQPGGFRDAQLELVIHGADDTPLARGEMRKIRAALPDAHEIDCVLLDRKTGRVLHQVKSLVKNLDNSKTVNDAGNPLVFNLFSLNLEQLSYPNDMLLKLSYRINAAPFKYPLSLRIILEPPTK